MFWMKRINKTSIHPTPPPTPWKLIKTFRKYLLYKSLLNNYCEEGDMGFDAE